LVLIIKLLVGPEQKLAAGFMTKASLAHFSSDMIPKSSGRYDCGIPIDWRPLM
jgi:hypothetical protein